VSQQASNFAQQIDKAAKSRVVDQVLSSVGGGLSFVSKTIREHYKDENEAYDYLSVLQLQLDYNYDNDL
jgi:hypothetical protein